MAFLDFSGFKLKSFCRGCTLPRRDFKLPPRMRAFPEELAARPDDHLLLGHVDDEGVVFISDDGGPPAVACCLK